MFRMLLPKLLEQQEAIKLNWGIIRQIYSAAYLGPIIYARSNADNENQEQSEKYDQQVKTIFTELVAWTLCYVPEAQGSSFVEKWACLSENFQNFYASETLQKQGKEMLETVYLLLRNETINLEKKISALQKIDSCEFSVCAPGIYTHLQSFVFSLTLNPIQLLKEEIIKAHALAFIKENKRAGLISQALLVNYIEQMRISSWSVVDFVLQDWELHYVNGLMDGIAKEWGLSYSDDLFVKSCDITQDFINKFNESVKRNFFASFMRNIEKFVEEQAFFIKNNAYAKTMYVLNQTLDVQFGEQAGSRYAHEKFWPSCPQNSFA